MRQRAQELRYLLFSQQLADGMRTTAAIVLPAVFMNQFGLLSAGMTVSLGALAASITDAPGPIINRRNSMLITAVLAFAVGVITAVVRPYVFLLGVEIAFATFLFSLLQVYGMRAAGVGTAAILILILTIGRTDGVPPVLYGFCIFSGGIWYTGISLFFYYIRPYRPAQRVLGDCIREVAHYLELKGRFYDVATDLGENYKMLVAQQVVVSEKQDAVREIFFKTARIVKENTGTGRRLVTTFAQTVDLFEDITATYYHYSTIRARFERSGILHPIAAFAAQLARALDAIGIAVQSNRKAPAHFDAQAGIRDLKQRIDALPQTEENTVLLKKILVNLRRIAQRISDINGYFDAGKTFSKTHVDHTQFISHQPLHFNLIWNNLNVRSTAFRYAVRLSIACLVGFAASKILSYGERSYWILLTIAFILKPAFSLTKTRNIERIWGTVAGGLAGAVFLFLVTHTAAQFVVMVLLMVVAFTFMRTRYVVMVICTTAYILILFQFLDIPFIAVVQERIFDTVLGCAIAFSAGYFLFPDWEAGQIRKNMAGVLAANAAYLQKIADSLQGKGSDKIGYKLARKQVYVESANLSAAYQRMAAEPRRQQQDLQHTHRFLVRNHLLFSNIAHVAALLAEGPQRPEPDAAAVATNIVLRLHQLSKKLERGTAPSPEIETALPALPAPPQDGDLMHSSLAFIDKLSHDIEKTTEAILAA